MPQLTLGEVEHLRRIPGRSLLFYLTDRCPVGCGHCSVDSRPDSPRITDWETFEAMVEGIAVLADLRLVGISGGEPFVERTGLTLATERIADAGKHLALFTSGVWARSAVPRWVGPILARASCVYLSTDSFDADAVDDDTFARAATAVVDQGARLIVQVLDETTTMGSGRLDPCSHLRRPTVGGGRDERRPVADPWSQRGARPYAPGAKGRRVRAVPPARLPCDPLRRWHGRLLQRAGPDRARPRSAASAVIDELGLDDDQAPIIGMSAVHTVGWAARAFDELTMGDGQ